MGAVGYHPVLIGRMHAVGPDQLHGYAERLVGDHSANHIGGSPVDHGILKGTAGPYRISLERSGSGQMAYQVHDEDVTAATVDYLNRLGVQQRAYGQIAPFSLSVGFMLPHPPYVARHEDYDHYRPVMTLPKKPRTFAQERHPFLRAWRVHGGIEAVSEDEILRARSAYWGLVQRVDCLVGQILNALQTNQMVDNTLIVYTSDHGDMQGEHGLWWKHVFYEESVKVPLIMNWPGKIPAGQHCARVVSALDLNATLLDALAAPPLLNSPGRSFLGLISDLRVKPAWEDVTFSEYCADEYVPTNIDGGKTYQRMVRQGDWKLIYYHGLPSQLFNLAEDPAELVDRADDPGCQALRADLTGRILADWNPDRIANVMAAKRADSHLLKAWAQQVQPPINIAGPYRRK
jgi:choline-sulfatase